MSMKSDEFIFREAQPQDGEGIAELLSLADFGGEIQLLYTRGKDPITSFRRDGEEVLVLCCRHTASERLAGFGVAAINTLWVDGQKQKVAYLSGLRVHPDFRRKTMLLSKAYEFMMNWLREKEVAFTVTSILKDNVAVQRMLEKKRKSMPWYHFLKAYRVYVLPKKKFILPKAYSFKKGVDIDEKKWREFYEREARRYSFYPFWDEIEAEQLRLLLDSEDNIVAACQYKKREDKKHFLHAYEGKAKLLSYLGKLPQRWGYPSMPRAGSFLDYEYLSYPLAASGQEEALLSLYRQMTMERENLHYLLVGCIEGSGMDSFLGKYYPLHYDSRLYLVDPWKDGRVEEWVQKESALFYEISVL